LMEVKDKIGQTTMFVILLIPLKWANQAGPR
jgi:hypothetical protein